TRSPGVPYFACAARVARSGAKESPPWWPHTWLSPATLALHSSTAFLRHVHGSPVLGLLRRLRPSAETSPGLAACRVFQSRRSARSSYVPVEDPWCGRWSAVPLAVLAVRRFGTRRAARRLDRRSRSNDTTIRIALRFPSRHQWGPFFVQRDQTLTSTSTVL